MKVIFLDVDGVLNSRKDNFSVELETDSHLSLLRKLYNATGAKIVMSPSWQRIPSLIKYIIYRLTEHGMYIHGITRKIIGATKAYAIKDYIEHSVEPIEQFVILDDEPDMGEYSKTNHVRTSIEVGLQPKDVGQAFAILRRNADNN
jgi:hypothetical protein